MSIIIAFWKQTPLDPIKNVHHSGDVHRYGKWRRVASPHNQSASSDRIFIAIRWHMPWRLFFLRGSALFDAEKHIHLSRCLNRRFNSQTTRCTLLTAPGILVILAVTHPRTNRAQSCLTLVIWRWMREHPNRYGFNWVLTLIYSPACWPL
jgi:hypothetical protein